MQHVSKLSAEGQITIPGDLRKAIGIEPGDILAYELEGDSLKLKRVDPFDVNYLAAIGETLEEWNSPEDEEAFNDL
jgi:antitoxin PrlF